MSEKKLVDQFYPNKNCKQLALTYQNGLPRLGRQNGRHRNRQQAGPVAPVQTVHDQRFQLLILALVLLPVRTDHVLRDPQQILGRPSLPRPQLVLQQRHVQDHVRTEHRDAQRPLDAVRQVKLLDQRDGHVAVAQLLVRLRRPEGVQDLWEMRNFSKLCQDL